MTELDERDLKVDTYTATRSKLIRVTHLPTGFTTISTVSRQDAIDRLARRVRATETNRSIND